MDIKNLLNVDDFLSIVEDDKSYNLAKIIKARIQNEIVISDGYLYVCNNLNVFEKKGRISRELLTGILNIYMNFSYEKLTNEQRDKIYVSILKQKKKEDSLKALLNDVYLGKAYPTLLAILTNNNINFDVSPNVIHFLNGKFNLRTGKMEERKRDEFITATINREYLKPKKKTVSYIEEQVKKAFSEEEAYNFMLEYYGASLCGTATENQKFLMNLGTGGAGKTSFLAMVKASVGMNYYKELSSDSLSKNKNNHKSLNSFNPLIRFYVVNETKETKLDTSLLKKIADGNIQVNKLYQDGDFEIAISGSLIFVANNMFSFNNDTGMSRRLLGYEYKNKFTDNKKEVDNKRVFLKNKKFAEAHKYFNDEERNAFFYILAKKARQYIKTKQLCIPECVKDTSKEIIEANDYWANFIDKYLMEKAGGKVAIDEILNTVRSTDINKKNILRSSIISEFKDRGIKYDRMKQVSGSSRGVIIGYVWKDDFIDDKSEKSPLEYEDLKLENQKLQELLKKHNITF